MTFQRTIPGLCLLLLLTAAGGRAAAGRIPVEDFFQNPEIAAPVVSPGGKYVAFLSPVQGRLSVILFDLATGKLEPIARAFDADITQIFWKGDERIIFSGDPNGGESRVLASITVATKSIQILSENLRERNQDAAFANLLSELHFDPTHILVYGRSSSGGWHAGLFTINLITADRNAVYGADPDTDDWAPDAAGEIRYRTRQVGDRTIHEVRLDRSARWTPIGEAGHGLLSENSPIRFVAFAGDSNSLFLLKADDEGRDSLYRYDCRTADWGAPLFTSDHGAIESVRLSWDRMRVESVIYNPDAPEEKWLDPHLAEIARTLRATIPGGDRFTIVSADRAEQVFTVVVYSDVNPGDYYLLDLRGQTQFVRLGQTYPKVPRAQLCPMTPVEYRARDGLVIHGYLTRPQGATGRVPLVILPHGGPFGIRDAWGYNPEVQFLANRGYAVLQPNYRGSGGYGVPFILAGRREWGGKMQDDLTDGVKWAVDQGIADPARVAIYGASYGGYAALAGAVFTPDLYRCAVNYVGPSDLTLISSWQHEDIARGKAFYHNMVGDDKEFLAARSPLNFVARIKIPLLNAYGENDPRVEIKHWDRLERELKKYGKTYEFIHEENEGHGFKKEETRINFYRRLEAFLDRYLAPPVASAAP